MMRLVFLGDSLTWGKYGGDYVAAVAARLPQHEIINAGESGNTVLNLLNRLDSVLRLEPDGIFVIVGGNDSASYSQPATRAYYRAAQKIPDGIVTPDLFARTYRDLLTRIQLAHVLAWVGLESAEYNPSVVAALKAFNRLARDAAQSLNVPVLDLMATFVPEQVQERPPLDQNFINRIGRRTKAGWRDYETERQRGSFRFTFDGVHFTPDAAQHAAEIIVRFLGI